MHAHERRAHIFDFRWNVLPWDRASCHPEMRAYATFLQEIIIGDPAHGRSEPWTPVAMWEIAVIQHLVNRYDTKGIRYIGEIGGDSSYPYLTSIVTRLLTSPA